MKRVILVLLAVLALAPEANAKMCVKIATVPAQPIVGTPVTIRVTALSIVVKRGRAAPGDQAIPLHRQTRLNLRVVAPDGTVRLVRVRRSPDRPSALEGSFTFPSAGAWTLSWAAWGNGNPACAGKKLVAVSEG